MAVKPRLLNYKRKKLNGNNDAVADGSVVVDEIVADDTMVEVTVTLVWLMKLLMSLWLMKLLMLLMVYINFFSF